MVQNPKFSDKVFFSADYQCSAIQVDVEFSPLGNLKYLRLKFVAVNSDIVESQNIHILISQLRNELET